MRPAVETENRNTEQVIFAQGWLKLQVIVMTGIQSTGIFNRTKTTLPGAFGMHISPATFRRGGWITIHQVTLVLG